jgi:hypothetical protein
VVVRHEQSFPNARRQSIVGHRVRSGPGGRRSIGRRASRPRAFDGRKVRAPIGHGDGQHPPAARPGKVQQKVNRHARLWPGVVRVKRRGKSSPAGRATGLARQTPPGARPSRKQATADGISPFAAVADRPGRYRLPGRPLEAPSNRRPREMAIARCAPRGAQRGQNPAYKSTPTPFFFSPTRHERGVPLAPPVRHTRAPSVLGVGRYQLTIHHLQQLRDTELVHAGMTLVCLGPQ